MKITGDEKNSSETDAVIQRYAKRNKLGHRYSIFRPEVLSGWQERQRIILSFLAKNFSEEDIPNLRLIEVGCGNGANLLDFLRFGFSPDKLMGIELLPERSRQARSIVPSNLTIWEGDASSLNLALTSQDIVFQSVVFSSLLDDNFQQKLAHQMWEWVKPGGGILWYDFIYNNPNNPDVRGVSIKRIKELFPQAEMTYKRITLAPPISRRVCQIHPFAYQLFNVFPFLRTHVMCWIHKKY